MASGLHLLLLLLLCGVSSGAQLKLFHLSASDLPIDPLGITDGYVKVFLGSKSLGRTGVAHNMVNPMWDEEFHFSGAQQDDVLRLEVYDEDLFFDDLLGVCQVQLQVGKQSLHCELDEGAAVLHYTYTLEG